MRVGPMTAATGTMRPDVPILQLDLGEKLGGGGQGEVFRLRNRPGEVFKRYILPNVNGAALSALVGLPGRVNDHDREALRRQAAWPEARVTDGVRVVGVLMREIPAAFFGRTAAGLTPRELQYLLYQPKPLWGDITPLDTTGRVEVAQEFLRLSRILQENNIVMGDVSMSNLLWCGGYPARIFLIDCDGFAIVGGRPVLPQAETVDWKDPRMPSGGPDLDTDRYKVALVVGRVLSGDATLHPGEPLRLPSDLPGLTAQLITECFDAAKGHHGTRPSVMRWQQAISGRATITLPPPRPAPPAPPMPMAPLEGRGPRPRATIQLPPPPRAAP
jgi:hypothetical protein